MDTALEGLKQCRTPQDIHEHVRRVGLANGTDFQKALIRNPRTPLADALRLFWYYDTEDFMRDRSTEDSAFLLEIIKRVEIGYYPKAGIPWSHFEDQVPTEDDIESLLEELQGIVPRCMLGTEFNS